MIDLKIRNRIAGERTQSGVADLTPLDITTSLVVEAGAGAGKTTLLVGRMVALIRTGVDVRHMAAITFTRKAAGEMRSRLFMELSRVWESLVDPIEKGRVERALNQLDLVQITTIHAFCMHILQTYPLEAGLPHRFTLLEDLDAEQETREAWERAVADLRTEHPEWIPAMEEAGVSLRDAHEVFKALLPYPDCDVVAPECDRPDLTADVQALAQLVSPLMEFAFENDIQSDGSGRTLANLKRRMLVDGLDTFAAQVRFLREFHVAELPVSNAKWKEFAKAAIIRGTINKAKEQAHKAFEPLAGYAAFVTTRVARFARTHFDTWRRTTGKILTDDLLHLTTRLLDSQSDVRKALQDTYKVLLVDEFQDTDPAQAHILMHLAGNDARAEVRYHQQRIRPGSLFVVGDPKQSIYRFRRASIEVFEQVRAQIERSGGESVSLTTNFRSLPSLCTWFNTSFSPLFAQFSGQSEGASVYGPNYAPFFAGRKEREGPVLHRLTVEGEAKTAAQKVRRDAERIADSIVAHVYGNDTLFGEGRSWGDFMVLTRSRTHLAAYAEALSSRFIPYTVTGEKEASKSPVLATLHDLLRVLRRPGDGLALVTLLRGLLGGCSDTDLYLYAAAGGNFGKAWMRSEFIRPEGLDPGVGDRLEKVFTLLRRAREAFSTQPLLLAYQNVMDDTGLMVASRLLPAGEREAGLLLRLRARVEIMAAEGKSWLDVEEEFRRYREQDVELPGMSLLEGSPNAVRLMNLHQAKGLQAPIVFLACPTAVKDSSSDRVKVVVVRHEAGMPKVYLSMKDTLASPDYETYQKEEKKNDEAEEIRLLYVAATRAEDHLVVSRAESESKWPWKPLNDAFPESVSEVQQQVDPATQHKEGVRFLDVEPWKSDPLFTLQSVTAGITEAEALLQNVERRDETESRKVAQEYGSAAHLVLETLITKRKSDDAFLERIVEEKAKAFDLDATNTKRLREMLYGFLHGSLWQELHLAEVVLCEVPFAYPDGPAKGITGIIDLAFKVGGAWHVVDFKSRRADIPNVLEKDHPYAQQVNAYAHALSLMVGTDVATRSIWFTENGTRVFV